MNQHALVMAGTGGIIVVGSIGPWAVLSSIIEVAGTRGDGQITLLMGIAVAVCGLLALGGNRPRSMLLISSIGAIIAGGIAGNAWLNVRQLEDAGSAVDAGWGVQITTAAVIPGIIVLIDCIRSRERVSAT